MVTGGSAADCQCLHGVVVSYALHGFVWCSVLVVMMITMADFAQSRPFPFTVMCVHVGGAAYSCLWCCSVCGCFVPIFVLTYPDISFVIDSFIKILRTSVLYLPVSCQTLTRYLILRLFCIAY